MSHACEKPGLVFSLFSIVRGNRDRDSEKYPN
jgi:hypothetical protein